MTSTAGGTVITVIACSDIARTSRIAACEVPKRESHGSWAAGMAACREGTARSIPRTVDLARLR